MKRRSAWCPRLAGGYLLFSACVLSGLPKAEGRELKAISILGFQFAPPELSVATGDTITWINEDALAHTATADSGAWNSPELARGQRFMFVAVKSGRFPYHCRAHPVMRATLVVRE